MKMINGVPHIVEGVAYYAHLGRPVPDYSEKQEPGSGKYGWEINLAVSDDTFAQFKEAGINVGMRPPGNSKYTPDPVITFYRYHKNYDGGENEPPKVVDLEKEPFTDMIGNGSKVAVQWGALEYSNKKFKRAIIEAVQVKELVEVGSGYSSESIEGEVAF
jgi:hypothetical protein|tara:strand:+ start:359 stop:838 length:480 start_codon:yes stop_codon:yes gene_type:complete